MESFERRHFCVLARSVKRRGAATASFARQSPGRKRPSSNGCSFFNCIRKLGAARLGRLFHGQHRQNPRAMDHRAAVFSSLPQKIRSIKLLPFNDDRLRYGSAARDCQALQFTSVCVSMSRVACWAGTCQRGDRIGILRKGPPVDRHDAWRRSCRHAGASIAGGRP